LSEYISVEDIYADFVIWNLIKSDFESLKSFFEQPTWLTLKHWNHYQKKQAQLLNQQSIATAKLSTIIVNIANSFGKENNKKVEVDEFTLYRFSSFDEENVSQEAVDILTQCNNKGLIADYAMSCFTMNDKILEALKK
jgi:hypothetical protein